MPTDEALRGMSREEEMKRLAEVDEKIKKDRSYGIRLAQRAGILDENGQLTEHYRPQK